MGFDIQKILEIMPHRYPFLLVDKIIKIEEDCIIGIKNVTINEPYFEGHFPGQPVMPGVLIVESLAQTGGILLLNKIEDIKDKLVFFAKIDKTRFKRPVVPGDTLRNEVKLLRYKLGVCIMDGKSYVGDELVAEGEFTVMIIPRKK